jgi:hypothetical protein
MEIDMYFVVPKDRSIIKAIGKFDGIWNAQSFADKLHAESGEHYDVIHMARVYTTHNMADKLEEDLEEQKLEGAL